MYLPTTHMPIGITNLFKLNMRLWQFTYSSKQAIVIPIVKPWVDQTNTTSYCPIAMISRLSKIMEVMVNSRLTWFYLPRKVVSSDFTGNQHFHYRQYHISVLECLRFVWLEWLLIKLKQCGINSRMNAWSWGFPVWQVNLCSCTLSAIFFR